MKLRDFIIIGCANAVIAGFGMKLSHTIGYMHGAYNAFDVLCKNDGVEELKVKVPFGKKKFDFKISK